MIEALDYNEDDDVEMLSDSEDSPKRNRDNEKPQQEDDDKDDVVGFDPVDDVDVFAVDDAHLDTSGGEIRRRTKFETTFDPEELGAPPNVKRYTNPKLQESTDQFSKFLNSDEQRTRRMERAKRFGIGSLDFPIFP